MRIFVDLSAVATDGTRNYAAGFGPALFRLGGHHHFKVLCSDVTWALLTAGGVPGNVEWEHAAFPHAALRVGWEQSLLPWKLWRWQADACFSPFDTTSVLAHCPVLLAVRNPNAIMRLQCNPTREPNAFQHPTPGILSRARVHHAVSRASCRKAARVFFPTAFASHAIGDALQVPVEKRAVVFHGTDGEFWRAPGDATLLAKRGLTASRYVLFVSRLYPQKRADLLIEAFAKWAGSVELDEAWRLVIVGSHTSAEQSDALQALVDGCGLSGRVVFLSGIERAELRALYQAASVFVLPTEMETFGQPFVEAMASGVPVVAADKPFARELCGDAARYFPAGDAPALASVLEHLVSNVELRQEMIERGRYRSTAFSWEREAAETLALLESLALPRSA